jgi:hypothetical protein
MRLISWTAALVLTLVLSTGFAQPRFSLGVTGGMHIRSDGDGASPIISASTWFRAAKHFLLSSEYQRFKGCDRYPSEPAGFVVGPFKARSSTQRLLVGLHYSHQYKNTSSLMLLGINFGHSWDKRTYGFHEISTVPPFDDDLVTDHVQRSLLFGSLSVLDYDSRFPFFFQARYGFSFSELSSLSFNESAAFGQLVIGVHLGIF